MKKGYFDVVMVLDRSGSMGCVRNDVIGGVNTFIDDQRKIEGECLFTLIQFNQDIKFEYVAIPINNVKHLDTITYIPNGTTALYDAIAMGINATGDRLNKMSEMDKPEKIIFIIQTDGYENASKEFKDPKIIKEMIKHQTDIYSWEFVFMGADIDASEVASSINISCNNSLKFDNNSDGYFTAYASVSKNLTQCRSGVSGSMAFTDNKTK